MQCLKLVSTFPLVLLALAGGAYANSGSEITERLQAAGYTEIRDVERDGGVWEAEVRRADGSWSEVAIDDAIGEIFDPRDTRPLLGARAIAEALESGGYREISDLDRDGALWEAEATRADGVRVELQLSGFDGRVVSSDVEYDD